jgi:hypothetical protein
MKRCLLIPIFIFAAFWLTCDCRAQTRFAVYDLYISPKVEPLAAYQIKIKATTGNVKIISVEGGEHSAFKEAPFFDPKAIQKGTIKLAAFSTKEAAELPARQTRVASIHIQTDRTDEVPFDLDLQVVATTNGRPIGAKVRFIERDQE